ncbi:T9SS type A sorting domain-containing protein [Methanohalobium sp.]|uniref:T9SS type A sorting domain-containing protein n=1 Tax=Methanohalobium sp. TaxID=2837493 RepID=UPI0025FE0BF0|nr:T9SS type A sorting domain-containing protein [Methanohalobium sp.]
MVQTFSDGSAMLTQGFHQGNITVSTAVDEMSESAMDVQIYPNPVNDILNVKFKNMVDQTIQVRLVDLTGKTILTREFSDPSNTQRLNLSPVTSGTYMLEVNAGQKRKVFKIVKH